MSSKRPEDRWHKGSRFWMFAPWVLAVSFGLTVWLKDGNIWIVAVTIVMTGAGAQTAIRHHHDGRARAEREDK